MKKIFVAGALILCLCGTSEAARVTKPYTFSAGQTIRSADVNSNFDTMYTEFNGSIEGGTSGNIKADSLTELDMADDINPRVRWDEGFQDFIYTGLQPATSANLTSDISAGTVYVKGYRVNKASATSKTYTNTKDTYVDIDYNGVFHYTEAVRLAAAPAVYTDSIRLAAVAAEGGALVQVTDLRVLTPYATGTSHIIARGFELVWASTTTITVMPGTLYHNLTRVDKTASTTLDITSAGDYIGGVSQRGTSRWLYVYCDASGNLDFEDSAPAFADASGNNTGKKIYASYSGTYYRCIGEIYLNAVGSGEIVNFKQKGNYVEWDTPIQVTTTTSAGAWSGAVSCAASVPPTSELAVFNVNTGHAGNSCGTSLRAFGATGDANGGVYGYGTIGGYLMQTTDSSQQIEHYDNAGDTLNWVNTVGYYTDVR